jgi:hypothetical protein
MKDMKELRLSDETIGHLAKILQLALLTGTDVVDNMRTIRLSLSEEDTIVPHPKYVDRFHLTITEMMAEHTKLELRETLEGAAESGLLSKEHIDDFVSIIDNTSEVSDTVSSEKDKTSNELVVEDNKTTVSEDVDEW